MDRGQRRGFTLVELLVVVGIIALLIGILLPTVSAARVSVKKTKVKTQLDAIKSALEMFRNDVGDYPDSEKQVDRTDSQLGGGVAQTFPPGHSWTVNDTTIWGAQLLAQALAGKDLEGYVNPQKARKVTPGCNPLWHYNNDESSYQSWETSMPRETVYLDENAGFLKTTDIQAGTRPVSTELDINNTQYVIMDAFEYPILYYKANVRGNIMASTRSQTVFSKQLPLYDPINFGIPIYNHLDNDAFTGSSSAIYSDTSNEEGWKFGALEHEIKDFGNDVKSGQWYSTEVDTEPSFVRYIHDHDVGYDAAQGQHANLVPHNPDTYLLITAGADGIYGNGDDITNFTPNF